MFDKSVSSRSLLCCLCFLVASLTLSAAEKKEEGVVDLADICSKVECTFGAQCEIDQKLNTKCVCPTHCEKYYDPVCGSDGEIYTNKCFMRKAACEAQIPITVSDLDSRCSRCRRSCKPFGSSNACGSDNREYSDYCKLKVRSCSERRDVWFIGSGNCTKLEELCLEKDCDFGGQCEVYKTTKNDYKARCFCEQDCPQYYDPICGSNGIMYTNTCFMRRHACRAKKEITVADNNNICSRCETDCDWGGQQTTCGSDGKEYNNVCDLRATSCMSKQDIWPVSIGRCARDLPRRRAMNRFLGLERAVSGFFELLGSGVKGFVDPMTSDGSIFGSGDSLFGSSASPFGSGASPFGSGASLFGSGANPFGSGASPFGSGAGVLSDLFGG